MGEKYTYGIDATGAEMVLRVHSFDWDVGSVLAGGEGGESVEGPVVECEGEVFAHFEMMLLVVCEIGGCICTGSSRTISVRKGEERRWYRTKAVFIIGSNEEIQ